MKEMTFCDFADQWSDLEARDGVLTIFCEFAIDVDRPKARELAAILTHFADTGELPGEVGDGLA